MKTNIAFWDTSAIVPLCAFQISSPRARKIQRAYKMIYVCWETLVEAYSAFNRSARNNTMTQVQYAAALRKLALLRKSWNEIPPKEAVREMAIDILESYPLRAGDALQLAAAMIWCDSKPRNRVFVTFDLLLADVAAQVGFTVVGL